MTSDSTAARSRRYGARGSSRIDDPVEYDEPANDDADDLDEYDDDDDDFVAVAAQVAATAAHASRTSRVARSSSIASGVVDPSPPPHRDPTEPGSERAAADEEEDDDDPRRVDARVSSRGQATAREVDSYSDERPRDARIVDAAAFETMSGDWTITIARTASGSSPPLDSPSSSSPGRRTLRLRAPRGRWVAVGAGALPERTEAEGDARAFGSDGKARDVSAGSSTRGRLARHPIARARRRARSIWVVPESVDQER